MSGGSFDYLYLKTLAEAMSSFGEFEHMLDAVSEYPNSDRAAQAMLNIREAMDDLEAEWEKLRDVVHAVEWHHSCDWGPEEVQEALEAYAQANA